MLFLPLSDAGPLITWWTWWHHEELCSCPGSPSCLVSAPCLSLRAPPSSLQAQRQVPLRWSGGEHATPPQDNKSRSRSRKATSRTSTHPPGPPSAPSQGSLRVRYINKTVSWLQEKWSYCTFLRSVLSLDFSWSDVPVSLCVSVFLMCTLLHLFSLPTGPRCSQEGQVPPHSYLSQRLLSLLFRLPLDMLSLQHWG